MCEHTLMKQHLGVAHPNNVHTVQCTLYTVHSLVNKQLKGVGASLITVVYAACGGYLFKFASTKSSSKRLNNTNKLKKLPKSFKKLAVNS